MSSNNLNIDSQSSGKSFWNKRNYILISITTVASIVLVVLTLIYILDIHWDLLFRSIAVGFISSLGWLWFILFLTFVIWNFFINVFTLTIRLGKLNIKVKFWNMFLYTLTRSFLIAVTPANFVSDPYTIFWLKTCGLSTAKASALVANNALLWEVMQIIITMPSFIWICIHSNSLLTFPGTSGHDGLIVLIFMIIGIAIDFIGLAVMFIFGFMRRLHYLLSRIFNRTKQLLHMKYHTKAQTYKTYIVDATLQHNFLEFFREWKITILVLALVLVNEVFLYFTIIIAFEFLKNEFGDGTTFDVWKLFNLVNVGCTANRFFPLPGGEGTMEYILTVFFKSGLADISVGKGHVDTYINNSVMVWRTFTQYIPAAIGLFGFVTLMGIQIKQRKKNKLIK